MKLYSKQFFQGYAYIMSAEEFERSYQMPFNQKSLSRYNRNPELLPHIPSAKNKSYFRFAFLKNKYSCISIGLVRYWLESILKFLEAIATIG